MAIISIICNNGNGSERVMLTMDQPSGTTLRTMAPNEAKMVTYKPTIPTLPRVLNP